MNIVKLFGIFISAFIVALSGALMPGPLLTVTITESMKRGKWTGFFLIIGHAILELGLILIIIAGFGHLFTIAKVVGVISILGGGILLWMGWDTLSKARGLSLSFCVDKPRHSSYGPVITGILASISNPYWSVWWATIGIGYVAASLIYGWIGIFTFFTGHIAADFAWYTLVSFGVCGGKRFLSNRLYRGIMIACGGILCLFGVAFLWFGFQKMGIL
ncbi:MAG: LysE family translocator [bacterium]